MLIYLLIGSSLYRMESAVRSGFLGEDSEACLHTTRAGDGLDSAECVQTDPCCFIVVHFCPYNCKR